MIYRRKQYKIKPEKYHEFNEFFHIFLLPNQSKHGATLVGRWVSENKEEVTAIWQYQNYDSYQKIEEKVKSDEFHRLAQEHRQKIKEIILESKQDFLTSTGDYDQPQWIVSVAGYITNDKDEILLVRTSNRSDTWEIPGGQVEEYESMEEAIHREIAEETGVKIELDGITGIYQNLSRGVINVTFRGKYIGGELRAAEGEISEVKFQKIDNENIAEWITRSHFRKRVIDAMNPSFLPYEIYKTRSYEVIAKYK
jgi:8-oxo-dGTP diphosphatase